jgi:hypothetical protein
MIVSGKKQAKLQESRPIIQDSGISEYNFLATSKRSGSTRPSSTSTDMTDQHHGHRKLPITALDLVLSGAHGASPADSNPEPSKPVSEP